MKIAELKKYVDAAYKKGKDCDVEVWIELEGSSILGEIESIGQFNFVPDMTLTIKPKGNNKIFSTKPLSKEQFDYKQKYEKISKKLEKLKGILNEI